MGARLLVFDQGPITSGNIHYWQSVTELGTCYVPEAVLDEVRRIGQESPLGKETVSEVAAKDFLQFWEGGGWQATNASKYHAQLLPATETLTRKLRLSSAVAQCAYALAQLHPKSLVVLVTEDQTLIRRISELGQENLGGASGIAVREWTKSKHPPLTVEKLAQQFSQRKRSTFTTASSVVTKLVSGITGVCLMLMVFTYGWYFLNPQEFERRRQEFKLPPLPLVHGFRGKR